MDSEISSDEDILTHKRKGVIEYNVEGESEEELPFGDYDDDGEDTEEQVLLNKAEDVRWTTVYRSTGWHENRKKFNPTEKGFTVGPTKIRTPMDAFMEYVDEEMLQLIVEFTNAEAVAAGDPSFRPVDKQLILAWLGCSINAGLFGSNHTNVDALWTTDSVNGNGFYRAVMSKQQYKEICRHIRFDDSVARRAPRQAGQHQSQQYERPKDRLGPIRPVMDIFQKNFRDKYHPGENITVDERTISFRGRCSFKVYNKSKPSPYGLKLFGVSDAENFYFMNFDLYAGKMNGVAEVGQGKRVVLQLTEPYTSSGRRIVFDNFFTSIPLAEELISRNLLSIGTLRKNKKEIPVDFQSVSGRQIGSTATAFKGEVMITSWVAKKGKHILMLSTDRDLVPSNSATLPLDAAEVKHNIISHIFSLFFWRIGEHKASTKANWF